MAGNKIAFTVAGIACVLVLASCSGTKLVLVWQDQQLHRPVQKVFVIGIIREQGPRSLIEDELVRRIRARGTDALASYPVFSTAARPDRDDVLAKAKELGVDAILVTRFVKRESGPTQTPVSVYGGPQGLDKGWDAFYLGYDETQYSIRDVAYDYYVVIMETTLYDVATRKPLWSALSKTRYEGAILDQIKPFAAVIVKGLAHEKFIR